MDTSASAQVSKATTEADKECYRKEGRCYECGKQGHIVRACPAKGRAPAARMVVINDTQEANEPPAYERIGKALIGFSEEDKQSFLDYMQKQGEEMGFGNA